MSRSLALVAACSIIANAGFDHSYAAYGELLQRFVHANRVDYQDLVEHRAALDALVADFAGAPAIDDPASSRPERMAFWINAYNALTLDAIAHHYPIRASWFTLAPRNSIRQIDGVWTTLRWRVAGRDLTLDDIEHRILRPTFHDPRVHFAINCASKSCPQLASEPYLPSRLDDQLDEAARQYLASPYGLQISGTTLKVSSIFNWYGDDFIERFASAAGTSETTTAAERAVARSPKERAILGVVARYGPPSARELTKRARVRIEFLQYDWTLNDIDRPRGAASGGSTSCYDGWRSSMGLP